MTLAMGGRPRLSPVHIPECSTESPSAAHAEEAACIKLCDAGP